jgi:hypothetical protein
MKTPRYHSETRQLGVYVYPGLLNIRCTPSMEKVVTDLARREMMSRSAWLRQAVLAHLQRSGVKLEDVAK